MIQSETGTSDVHFEKGGQELKIKGDEASSKSRQLADCGGEAPCINVSVDKTTSTTTSTAQDTTHFTTVKIVLCRFISLCSLISFAISRHPSTRDTVTISVCFNWPCEINYSAVYVCIWDTQWKNLTMGKRKYSRRSTWRLFLWLRSTPDGKKRLRHYCFT